MANNFLTDRELDEVLGTAEKQRKDFLTDRELDELLETPEERRKDFLNRVSEARENARDNQLAIAKLKVNGREQWRPAANFENILNDIFLGKGAQATGSDSEVADILMADAYDAEVRLVDRIQRAEQRGEFYPYLLTDEAESGLLRCGIDLRSEQVYSESSIRDELTRRPNEVTRHCLWNTLKRLLPDEGEMALTQLGLKTFAGTSCKKRALAAVAKLYECDIRLLVINDSGTQSRIYKGNVAPALAQEKELKVGMISGHFFVNTTHDMKDDIKNLIASGALGGANHDTVARGDKSFRGRGSVTMTTANLLKKLQDHGLSRPYTPEMAHSLGLARTEASLKGRNPFINDLLIPEPTPASPIVLAQSVDGAKGDRPQPAFSVWYADFETFVDADNTHVPYLACAIPRGGGSTVVAATPRVVFSNADESLGKKLLTKICKRSSEREVRIYFHNARYDCNFLYDSGLGGVQTIENDGRLYQLTGSFVVNGATYKVTVRDTYSYLAVKLKKFHDMFDIPDQKWDDFRYDLFTRNRLGDHWARNDLFTEDELALIPERYRESESVCIYRYACDYCETDVKVLQQGFDKFRELALELGIDVDGPMTAASFAMSYLEQEGVLDDVEQLSGTERAYVQESIIGGRVCIRGNKPIHYVADKEDSGTNLVDVDAISLYPSAMAAIPGLPTGRPVKFEGAPPDVDNPSGKYYVATVRVLVIGRELHFSTLSKQDKTGGRSWGKGAVKVGDVFVMNRVQIESAQRHQEVIFEFVGGLRWPDGYNPKIRETIRKLFKWRLDLKAEENPLQLIVKLIMNSAYGKLAQRPHDSKVKWIRGGEAKALSSAAEAGTGFVYLESANRKRTLWKLKYNSPDITHSNRAHCGSLILAQSKEIMYQVTTSLDDDIIYSDTDSMILPASALERLNRPELIGKKMGQFHTDLSWNDDPRTLPPSYRRGLLLGLASARVLPSGKGGEVTGIEGMFLAKKTFVMELVNTAVKGVSQHHVRAKGIPNSTISVTCEKGEITPMELYKEAYANGVEFDMTAGRPCFKQHPTSIATVSDFTRRMGPFCEPAWLSDEDLDETLEIV